MSQIIGAQLFTLRDRLRTEEEVVDGMHRLAAMGFTHLQWSGVPAPLSTPRIREILDEAGLSVCCTHMPWERLIREPEQVAEDNLVMGCPLVGLSHCPAYGLSDAGELRHYLDDIGRIARVMNSYGLKFALHNHRREFQRIDGKTVFEHLRDHTDPQSVEFILCFYWMQAAGVDPVAAIGAFAGRISCCHYKDMTVCGDTPTFAVLGQGNMNYPAIYAACEKAGVRYALIEQDDCHGSDPFDCLKDGRDYLLSLSEA